MELKKFIFEHIDFDKIENILDLGCGNCDDLRLMQKLYPSKNKKFYGVDKIDNKSMKGIRYLRRNINYKLPFNDKSFDLIYSHNLLECIKNKKSHIEEIYRLLKKSGKVVYSHTDWDSQLIDGDNKELIRRIVKAYAEWKQPWLDNIDSWQGRRLWGIFDSCKLFSGEIKSYTIINTDFKKGNYSYNMINSFKDLAKENLITKEEYKEFLTNVKSYQRHNKFFYAITSFIYYGKKSK